MTADDAEAVRAWLDQPDDKDDPKCAIPLNGKALKANARRLLEELAYFRAGKKPHLTYRPRRQTAIRWNVTEDTIRRAFRQLEQAGLIEMKEAGNYQRASRYVFTDRFLADLEGLDTESVGTEKPTPREEPVGTDLEGVGTEKSGRRGTNLHPEKKEKNKEEAAAREEPESPNPEAGEETRTTANGATYTEADYREWCRRKAESKNPDGKGLEIKIYREDRAEFEAQLRKAEGQARATRAQRQLDEDRRNCPFNHTEAAPGLGYQLADGTPTTYDHPNAEPFICEHGKPDTATRAQTRESGDLTGIDAIAEELIHR